MLSVVIMAGGVGSRFWPQSTPEKPKQFLKLVGNKTMIQMTYERMNRLVPSENIFIVTNSHYVDLVKEQLPDVKDINIITEPCGRNTAPCILLSSLYIKNLYGESNVICVASDSYIAKEDEFIEIIKQANEFINKEKKAIVTLGITPTRPETGYGYIKYQKDDDIPHKVIKFVEKPNLELAIKYMESDEYLWNAGMFIFNSTSMLAELEKYLPDEYNLLKGLPKKVNEKYYKFLEENYEKCNKISIDYAVMEKSPNVYAIPSDIGWDDVGSWKSLERYTEKDDLGNVVKGDAELIDSHNNVIYGHGKKIVFIDTNDLFCIDSDDAIIIGKREDLNKVHLLKEKLK